MPDETEKVSIVRISEQDRGEAEDLVVSEFFLTIIFNNRELVTLLCSPSYLKQLAVGFLASEGLIRDKNAIKSITLDDRRGIVRVETKGGEEPSEDLLFKRLITSGCGRGVSFYNAGDAQSLTRVESSIAVSPNHVSALMKEFLRHSGIYKETSGVHSAALCDTKEMLLFRDDIGRHNAVDKVLGECILSGMQTGDHMLATSGRISSEILFKIMRANVPVVMSKAAPTASAVRLAIDLGITLIGFVRGRRMNVYANSWRVT